VVKVIPHFHMLWRHQERHLSKTAPLLEKQSHDIRLVSEMTYYVSSETLNSTYSLNLHVGMSEVHSELNQNHVPLGRCVHLAFCCWPDTDQTGFPCILPLSGTLSQYLLTLGHYKNALLLLLLLLLLLFRKCKMLK